MYVLGIAKAMNRNEEEKSLITATFIQGFHLINKYILYICERAKEQSKYTNWKITLGQVFVWQRVVLLKREYDTENTYDDKKCYSLLKSSPKMNGWRMTMTMAKMPVTAWLVQWTKHLHFKQQHTVEMCDCWLFMGIFVCITLTMNAKYLKITTIYETRCSVSPLWHPSFLSRLNVFSLVCVCVFYYYHI